MTNQTSTTKTFQKPSKQYNHVNLKYIDGNMYVIFKLFGRVESVIIEQIYSMMSSNFRPTCKIGGEWGVISGCVNDGTGYVTITYLCKPKEFEDAKQSIKFTFWDYFQTINKE